jgi:acyl carrier protein
MSDPTKNQIRAFIVDNFLFGDTERVPGDELSLIENDLVDSTGILELVSFLEERFGIPIADADIVPTNLDSIARIAAFVARKHAAVG